MDRAVSTFVAIGFSKVVGLGAALVTTLLIGRALGPTGLGRWMLLVAASTMLHTALISWTQPSIVRFGSEEWALRRSLAATLAGRAPFLVAGVTAALLLLVLQPGDIFTKLFGARAADMWFIGSYTLGLWIAAEAQAILQATDRMMTQAKLATASAVLSIVVLVMLQRTGRLTVESAMLASMGASLLVWLPGWLRTLVAAAIQGTTFKAADLRRHAAYGLPLLFTFAIGYVSDWGDHLLLRVFTSTALVGFFALAYQIFTTLLAANGMLATVFLPKLIARQVRAEDTMAAYLSHVVPTVLTLWIIGTIWVVALAPLAVVSLAGSAFPNALAPTLVLCAVVPSSVVTSLYTVLFNVQQRMPRLLAYASIMTVTNLLVSIVLIPIYGIVGSAIATAVSYVIGQSAYVWDQHHHLAVSGSKTWAVWTIGVSAGLLQAGIGRATGARAVWAIVSSVVVVLVARRAGAVDSSMLARIFSGPLAPFAPVMTRMLVNPALSGT